MQLSGSGRKRQGIILNEYHPYQITPLYIKLPVSICPLGQKAHSGCLQWECQTWKIKLGFTKWNRRKNISLVSWEEKKKKKYVSQTLSKAVASSEIDVKTGRFAWDIFLGLSYNKRRERNMSEECTKGGRAHLTWNDGDGVLVFWPSELFLLQNWGWERGVLKVGHPFC